MSAYAMYGFRAVLFWTELKLNLLCLSLWHCFRAVLFWTELKPK